MDKQDLAKQVKTIVDNATAKTYHASIRKLLNLSMTVVKVTSAILNQYNENSYHTTVICESRSASHTGVLERTSDEGETYDEREYDTAYEWITGDKREPLIMQKDELKILSPEHREFIEYGVYTIMYLPVKLNDTFWGYVEFWESRFKRKFKPEEIELLEVIIAGIQQVLAKKSA